VSGKELVAEHNFYIFKKEILIPAKHKIYFYSAGSWQLKISISCATKKSDIFSLLGLQLPLKKIMCH
jgi:hypothetical protein